MILMDRLDLLLDSTFIHFAADCYQWALDSEIELNSLDEEHRKEVLTYHRGDDYKSKALLLVNQEYRETIKEKNISDITKVDLERSWHIVNRIIPKDPLGLIYGWFTSHATLYIPDRFQKVLRPIEAENKDEALDILFKDFMKWADEKDHLRILSFKAGDAAYIDEVEGLFKSTIKLLTTKNSYLTQLFRGLSATRRFGSQPSDIDSAPNVDNGNSSQSTG